MSVQAHPYRELLVTYIRPQWKRAALLAALIFGTIGLQLVNPQIIRSFIDSAQAGSTTERLVYAGLLFLGSALLLQVMQVATTYVGEDVGWRATNALRADLMDHCLRLDMSFHNDRTPGELIERIDGDMANLAIFFSNFAIRVVGSLFLLAGVLLVLLWENWRISLALGIYAVVALAALVLVRTIAVPHWKATREVSADLFGFLEEQLAGTEDIRSSGATPYVMRNLFHFNRVRLQKERTAGTMNALMVSIWFVLRTVGQLVALVTSYLLFRNNLLTIGTVYLIVNYTDTIFWPLQHLTEQIQNFQKAAASVERLQELYNRRSAMVDGIGTLPVGPLAVAFEDVSFSYKDEKRKTKDESQPPITDHQPLTTDHRVLRDVSFQLKPGEVLGLLGRTGSGKTTVTRLLFRLYDPQVGAVRLGCEDELVDLHTLSIEKLRRRVGMVTQDVQLFRASVRDNLTFFDRTGIADTRILEVIDDLGLGPWLRRLPNGLDSELEGASGLSAGEAQLLAFARVFLQDPGLVILDEASSRLDPATEALIEHVVDKLLHGRTAIVIAHRLHTVHRADQIVILENGRMRERGAYADLVGDPDTRFSQLLRTGMEEVLT